MNYFTLLEQQADRQPQNILLRLDRRAYTYAAVRAAAARLAAEIPCRRQIVLIDSPDPAFQLIAFLALQAADNIAVISHCDLPRAALRQVMDKRGIRHLLADRKDALDAPWRALPSAFFFTAPGAARQEAASICMGALSSGSTGVPKLLLRTYESWADFFPVQNRIFCIDSAAVLFMHGSLGFTGNLNALLAALSAGASIILAEAFRCKTWIHLIETHQATAIYLVPTKLKTLEKFIQKPFASVKMIFTGSQLLFSETAAALKAKLPNGTIILYYGASELNYITYIAYEELLKYPMSIGKPFPGVAVSVKNGTIYVTTPYCACGTAAPATVEDTGYFNAAGHLIFQGRKQAIINKGGFKVSCAKVEQAFLSVPGIRQAAVLPCADEKRGSELAAFLAVETAISVREIRRAIKKTLLPVEVPKKIRLLPQLPLNSCGKIDTAKLWKFYENH